MTMTFKFYSDAKGWGFVVLDDGRDAFLHESVAKLYGLRSEVMVRTVRVRCDISYVPGRRPEITAIAIA